VYQKKKKWKLLREILPLERKKREIKEALMEKNYLSWVLQNVEKYKRLKLEKIQEFLQYLHVQISERSK
jgi:hypothetical protein